MSTSPNNANLGFHWHMQPGASAPSAFVPPVGDGHEALQALLAFSALHDQVRRQALADVAPTKSGQIEKFVLDEVLQLVADRAVTLTAANGVAIALAEGGEIICRASSGTIAPDKQAKLNPNSGFSGACFRTGQIVRCDDTENDPRVNVNAARRLGTRSMVAVPLGGKDGTIGLIEAFSSKPYAFQDNSIRTLNLLAELILAAMKPEAAKQPLEALPEVPQPVEEPTSSAPVQEQPLSAETVVTETTTEAVSEYPATAIAEPLPIAHFEIEEPKQSSQPGLKIVVGIVLLAVLAGAGIWWKLHAGQNTQSSAAITSAAVVSQSIQQGVSPASTQDTSADKSDEPTAVTDIRHWSSLTSSTVVIDLQDSVRYEEHRLSYPDRIYFDLPGTTLEHKLVGKIVEIGDSFLLRVRVAQPTPGTTRVVLDTKNNPGYTVRMDQTPYRLVVEIHNANAPAPPKANLDLFAPSKPPALGAIAQPQVTAPNSALLTSSSHADKASPANIPVPKFRIALDAGHGGWDEGTIGRKGLMEKDLALDIVARLGKLVTEKLGGEVIYTRRDDSYIPLEKRAEIANLAQADFFVSIHANYSATTTARGVETYYSNTYSSLNARVPGTDETVQPVNWTNVDIRGKAQQSQKLATSVQNALYDRVARTNSSTPNRGVKKASYVVLTGTTMPAILAEVSFISSASDEKSLKRSAYRQQIAEALYSGIAKFVTVQRKMTLASATSKPTGR
ncbi:MAG TPA: N-acetylmuramoyl-L-alanine amidase [Terriglobales bacterium]|nr:N-acetylmuramoyl-L-alanine amidase [Terriglobales bacterium]